MSLILTCSNEDCRKRFELPFVEQVYTGETIERTIHCPYCQTEEHIQAPATAILTVKKLIN